MKPGRELDALIAEKVMGWRQEEHLGLLRQVWKIPKDTIGEGLDWRDEAPPYSTDIAAAWEVVEKMSVPGRGFQIWRRGGDEPGFYVHFHKYDSYAWGSAQGESHSAPYAICMAAMAVKHPST